MKKAMQSLDPQIDPTVQRKLMSLRTTPDRDPEAAQRGRVNFLAQAESLSQSVSKTETVRPSGWNAFVFTLFNRKEHAPMFAPLVSMLLVASLLLGGAGATIVAAQGSLPDQPLYSLKIMSEDARIELAAGDQNKLQYQLEYANRRVEEIRALLEKGEPLQEAVLTRLQNQLEQALRLAAGLDEDQVKPALEQIRQALQNQEKVMAQLQANAGSQADPKLIQARQMIQTHLQWAENGLGDPQTFRQQFRQQGPGLYGSNPTSQPDGTPSGFGPGPSATSAPGNSFGPGPEARTTTQPENGKSYGPGPYLTGTPTPGNSYGPGPGPGGNDDQGTGNGYGPGPNPTSTPTPEDGEGTSPTEPPASGYGPGPYITGTPTPGSGYGPGPGPEPSGTCTPQSGPGGPLGPGGGNKP